MMISTLMSGYSRNSRASFGTRIVSVAFSVAVIRIVPAGFSRSSLTAATSASISSKRGPNIVKQAFPGFRRRDASRSAAEEPNAEPLFEFSQGMAQGRLRDAQLGGCFGETALSRNGDKG